jgi:tripartite-type tricarboxylate transporter receptor subunit TctC
MKTPDIVERMAAMGNEPVGNTPAEFDSSSAMKSKWGKVIRDARSRWRLEPTVTATLQQKFRKEEFMPDKKLIPFACVAMLIASPAFAADAFPTKPVRIVVPFAAGGS